MNEKGKATILIVDDHPVVRAGLASCISIQPDMNVFAEVASGEEALGKLKEGNPDLVIIDISLKTMDGIDLLKRIKDQNNNIKILIYSMYSDMFYADRALSAGASGYITKEEEAEKVIGAIRQALKGEIYLSPTMTQCMLNRFAGRSSETPIDPVAELTDRELEVLRLIGEAQTTRQISHRLKRSIHTIDTHRENIKNKLGLKNAAELSRFAVQWIMENRS